MANKSVLSKPSVSSSLPRNAFNRSGYRNYHQSAGMFIPVFAEPCIAGTKGVINRSIFTRAAQVVSPAFPDVKQSVEFFKVPLRYLLTSWNDWKLNINDLGSTAIVPQTNGVPNLSLPNSIPCMNFGYDSSSKSLFERVTSALTSLGVGAGDQPKYVNNMIRLLQGLGYSTGSSSADSGNLSNVKNLFKIAAYNKVYYDHFRNTTYESNNPYTYNLDWLLDPNNATNCILDPTRNTTHAQVFFDMFNLKYVNYKNDFYHNFFPSLNTSVSVPVGNWRLPNNVVGAQNSSSTYSQPVLNGVSYANQSSPNVQSSSGLDGGYSISVQQIRSVFALDKLMRASAYTPKHVREQIKVRFGVDVGDKVSSESERLGGFDNEIIFGEVTNTAASSSNLLGEVGGKGISAKNFEKDIHFYCDEDSLIIGVTYIKPSPCYDFLQDEWDDNLVKEDFWQPEFANLGFRPVYNSARNVIAYTVPYQRYKLGRDMNLGIFNDSTYESIENSGSVSLVTTIGALSNFTIHSRLPSSWQGAVSAEYFKVLPSHLDSIFAVAYDDTYGSPQTDQFFYHLDIKFAVTANMSIHGVPRL